MSSWEILHRWYMPFVWLTLSSLVAVPVAIYFQQSMPLQTGAQLGFPYGDGWVLRDQFLETIVVYGLNLGCAVWFLDAEGSTRWAAFWASLVAIGRIAAPVTLVQLSDVAGPGGQHYIDWSTLRVVIWFTDFQMFAFGILLWLAFRHFVGQTGGAAQPAHPAHAEAY